MSRSTTQSLLLHSRLRKWVIGAAVVALAAWLFEFSTHLHFADADDAGAPSAAHLCGYCAAMQVGAGPVAVVVHFIAPSTAHVEPKVDESFSSASSPTPYLSRAPPAA